MKVLLMARYRYKRGRRGYRRSTHTIMMKFQSFMDISTDVDSMKIITISAGGVDVLRRLAPQFGAYKYYRLGNVAVKLVPASTLPVDPTGLSIDPNTDEYATVDPRDQLTPGLMRITNGEDVFEDITGLSSDVQHAIYNNMLLDPRWYKWMLQSGVKRHATPRFWQIGQLHQDKWPGTTINVPQFTSTSGYIEGTSHRTRYAVNGVADNQTYESGSSPYGFFQVGHTGRLGWMPTDGLAHTGLGDSPLLSSPVEVEVMKIILPKAFKTRYWYRAFITETVYFREPIVNFGIVNESGGGSYRPLDIFHIPGVPERKMPYVVGNEWPDGEDTGGNYGDD